MVYLADLELSLRKMRKEGKRRGKDIYPCQRSDIFMEKESVEQTPTKHCWGILGFFKHHSLLRLEQRGGG